MVTFNDKIAILGLGLMGGSLGAALVRNGHQVAGWDIDPCAVEEAFRMGAINVLAEDFAGVVSDAQFIFVATPVLTIAGLIRQCLPYIKPGTVFSDLGSIKGLIIQQVNEFLPEGCFFVPGHPMTGSERHGITAADPFLFENAAYILIETPALPVEVLTKIKQLLAKTGAHLIVLTADDHDRIVGMVSHLPHLVSAVLAQTAGVEEEQYPGTLALAAGGFRDTTRLALGSPKLWEEIITGNRDKILTAITAFQEQLERLKQIIATDNRSALNGFLSNAHDVRAQIPAKNKGIVSLVHEMVVTIEDRPGTIEAVLRHLSKVNINVKDVEILRVREGDGGTLKLALENDQAVETAIRVLREQGFKAWRR